MHHEFILLDPMLDGQLLLICILKSPTETGVHSIGSKLEGQLLHICSCICIFEKSEVGWPVGSYLYLYF